MPEHTDPTPAPTPETEEAKRRKDEETDVDELVGKLYDAFARLGTAIEKLTTSIASASEAERGLMESLGKKMDNLSAQFEDLKKAITVGLERIGAEHAKADKFSGGPKNPEAVGEVVTMPNPSQTSVEMLEKAARAVRDSKMADVAKGVAVVTPRAGVEVRSMSPDETLSLVRDVLSGKVRGANELAERTRQYVMGVRA